MEYIYIIAEMPTSLYLLEDHAKEECSKMNIRCSQSGINPAKSELLVRGTEFPDKSNH